MFRSLGDSGTLRAQGKPIVSLEEVPLELAVPHFKQDVKENQLLQDLSYVELVCNDSFASFEDIATARWTAAAQAKRVDAKVSADRAATGDLVLDLRELF